MKDELINRMEFPKKAIVNKILAKETVAQSGGLTSKEKDYLTSEIERIYILAVLNEQSTNIPAFKSEQYRYEEILCLHVQLRSTAKVEQLIKLFHAIFPNPVFLIIGLPEEKLILSACHKRLNLQDDSKVVGEQLVTTKPFRLADEDGYEKLLEAMAFSKLHFGDLYKLYDQIVRTIQLSHAIHYIGTYPSSNQDVAQMIDRLHQINMLESAIRTAKNEQKKAVEFNGKMDCHMKVKRYEQELKNEIDKLKELHLNG